MKRLMVMIGAVATALGLYAAAPATTNLVVSAAGFEAYDPGVPDPIPGTMDFTATEGDPEVLLWSVAGTPEAQVKYYTEDPDDGSYLEVETDGAPIYRTFADASDIGSEQQTDPTNYVSAASVYVDMDVKLSPFEEAPTLANGSKIAVWVKATEDDGEAKGATNLVVTCGYLATDGTPTATNIVLDTSAISTDLAGAWHRLTIISKLDDQAGVNVNYFFVYLDGVQLSAVKGGYDVFEEGAVALLMSSASKKYIDAMQLFPSMVKFGSDYAKVLSMAGFEGSGQIDNLVVGEGSPYIQTYTITVPDNTTAWIDGVQTNQYDSTPGVEKTVTLKANAGYLFSDGKAEKEFTYVDGQLKVTDPAQDTKATKAGFAIILAETSYYLTLDSAVADVVNNGTITVVDSMTITNRFDVNTAKAFTIDLNEKTITPTKDCANGSAFNIIAGTVTIANGTIDGSAITTVECDPITVRSGAVANLVDGLTILINTRNGACAYAFEGGKINISGGIYDNKTLEDYEWKVGIKGMPLNQQNIADQLIEVTGGKFRQYDPANGDDAGLCTTFLANGYCSVVDSDGWFTVAETVATIGDAKFQSLQAAVDAAADGQTVKLAKSITLAARVEFTTAKTNTIDLGGNTITTTETCGNGSAFNIGVKGETIAANVTIKNGTIDGTGVQTIECDPITVRAGATANLVDGLEILIDTKNGACAYAFEGGKINISGGIYDNQTLEDYEWKVGIKGMPLNQANIAAQLIEVTGGKFRQYNPANGDDAGLCKTFLADGYTSKKVGEYWVVGKAGFVVIIAGNDPVYYDTLAEAVANAPAGATVKVLADAELADAVRIDKALTLDLDGKTLTGNASTFTTDSILIVKHGGSLTVTGNGTIDASANPKIYSAIKLTDKGDVDETNAATLVVENGNIYGYYYGITGNGNPGRGNTVITINGGTVKGFAQNDCAGIFHPQAGVLTLNGGVVEGAVGVWMKSGACNCTVNSGCTIKGTGIATPYVTKGDGFIATGDAFVCDNAGYVGGAPAPAIAGGTFTSANGSAIASYAREGNTAVTEFVTGGTFNTALAAGILSRNVALVKVGDVWTTAEAVANIGTTGYATLDAALAAAKAGETVKLLKNIETANKQQFTVASNITLDFNGKTITKSLSNDWVIRVNNGVEAIFTDSTTEANGGITFNPIANGNPNYPASMIQIFGKLTVNGGKYVSDFTIFKVDEDGGCHAKGDLVVNGGTFTINAKPAGYTGPQWAVMNWSTATIAGGTWSDGAWIASRSCDRNTDSKFGATTVDTSKVAGTPSYVLYVGYQNDTTFENMPMIKGVEKSAIVLGQTESCELSLEVVGPDADGWYTVAEMAKVAKIGDKEYATLGEAVANVQAGEKIVLLADYELIGSEDVTFTKNATLDLGGFTLTAKSDYLVNKKLGVAAGADVIFTNGTIALTSVNYTIQVNGKITTADITITDSTTEYGIFDVYGGGEVVVNDGTVIDSHGDVFRHKEKDTTTTITINGGSITGRSYAVFYVYKDGCTVNATIKGGTFTTSETGLFDESKIGGQLTTTLSLDADCKAKFDRTKGVAPFVADGYALKKGSDNYYTVVKAYTVTVADAITGGTVETSVTNNVLEGTTVTVKATAASGYKLVSITTNGTVLVDSTFEMPAENVTVAATFEEDAKPVNPEQPSEPYDTKKEAEDAAKKINDNKETMINTPTGATPAQYTALFTAVVTADNKVVVELNETGTNTLQTSANALVKTVEALGTSATEVTITPAVKDIVPGFYYGLGASTTVAGDKVVGAGQWKKATTAGLEALSATKPAGNAGFFQVQVSVKEPNN